MVLRGGEGKNLRQKYLVCEGEEKRRRKRKNIFGEGELLLLS